LDCLLSHDVPHEPMFLTSLQPFVMSALLCLRFTVTRGNLPLIVGVPVCTAFLNVFSYINKGYRYYGVHASDNLFSEYLISLIGFLNLIIAVSLIKEGKVKSSKFPFLMVIFESIFATFHTCTLIVYNMDVQIWEVYAVLEKVDDFTFWVMAAVAFVVLNLELKRSKTAAKLPPSYVSFANARL
ncbi:hypothetical protein PFISCL1PPCAC_3167, partial [Pristionchus fissidentatus]